MVAAMAGANDVQIFKDALVLLGTAAIVAPTMPRLKVSPVLGYLVVGAILGPYGLGRLAEHSSVLDWLTVTEERQISVIADLGIVFLLFFIGLELSVRRLMTMRRLVFGLGGLQTMLTTVVLALVVVVVWADAWSSVGHFFTGLTVGGLTGLLAVLAALLLAGGHATIRRATV